VLWEAFEVLSFGAGDRWATGWDVVVASRFWRRVGVRETKLETERQDFWGSSRDLTFNIMTSMGH
jgi:hypothetical protein